MGARRARVSRWLAGAAMVAALGMAAAILLLLARLEGAIPPGRAVSERIEMASRLRALGLPLAALAEFEEALRLRWISDTQRARLCYLAGNIASEDLHDHERALGFYHRSRLHAASTREGPDENLTARIEECEERMGRTTTASRRRDATGREGMATVAGIAGGRRIPLWEVEDAYHEAVLAGRVDGLSLSARLDFMRRHVALEALADEARERGLARDPAVLHAVGRAEVEALARRLLELDAGGRLRIEPGEVESLFAERQQEFNRPRRVRVAQILALDNAAAEMAAGRLENNEEFAALARSLSRDEATREKGGEMGWVEDVEPLRVPGLEDPEDAARLILSLNPGEVSPPFQSRAGVHLFMALEVEPGESATLDDVRPWIERDLREAKRRRLEDEAIRRVLRVGKASVFSDVLSDEETDATAREER